MSLGQQRKSVFNALLYKKHPSLYRTHIQGAPPWLYYGIVAALLTGASSVGTGKLGLAAGAAGVWLALTAHFCRRRLQQTAHTPSHIAEMIVTSALIPLLSVFWRLYGAMKFRVLLL